MCDEDRGEQDGQGRFFLAWRFTGSKTGPGLAFVNTSRLLGTNPAFAIQSIDQLLIAGYAVNRSEQVNE